MSKVVIVTGGSRGIGAATALLAAKQGYAVCVNYQTRVEAADTVVEAVESEGGRAIRWQVMFLQQKRSSGFLKKQKLS